MPQIDFGKAFATSDPAVSKSHPEIEKPAPPDLSKESNANLNQPIFRGIRLGRSDWANIVFVIVALSGGLFCAFYFFNGAELVRAALAWPRELLYSRPFGPADTERLSDIASSEQADPGNPTAASDNRRPFGRHVGNLQLNSPLAAQPVGNLPANPSDAPSVSGAPTVPSAPGGLPLPSTPGAGNLLGQLGRVASGGDGLTQAFNKGVADLQRATRRLSAARTVVVLRTRPRSMVSSRRVASLARKAGRDPANAVVRVRKEALDHSVSARSAENRANAGARMVANAGRSGLGGLGRSNTIGGFGRGGLGGGLGGVGSGFGRGGGLGGSAEGLGGMGRAIGGHGGGGRR